MSEDLQNVNVNATTGSKLEAAGGKVLELSGKYGYSTDAIIGYCEAQGMTLEALEENHKTSLEAATNLNYIFNFNIAFNQILNYIVQISTKNIKRCIRVFFIFQIIFINNFIHFFTFSTVIEY